MFISEVGWVARLANQMASGHFDGGDQVTGPPRFNAPRRGTIFECMTETDEKPPATGQDKPRPPKPKQPQPKKPPAEEIGGYDGQEPTTFGDWQHKGRVTDF